MKQVDLNSRNLDAVLKCKHRDNSPSRKLVNVKFITKYDRVWKGSNSEERDSFLYLLIWSAERDFQIGRNKEEIGNLGGIKKRLKHPGGKGECFSSVQSLSHVQLCETPWIAARQASLSITNSQSSLRLTSIESVMPSSHLILCHPLFLLSPIPPSIRVFSSESTITYKFLNLLGLFFHMLNGGMNNIHSYSKKAHLKKNV